MVDKMLVLLFTNLFSIYNLRSTIIVILFRGRGCRYRMIAGFISTYAISTYHH